MFGFNLPCLQFLLNLEVGYTTSGYKGIQFGEASWMDSWVEYQGFYETTKTVVGVTFVYKRTASSSTITIAGKWAVNMINKFDHLGYINDYE
jgi:hypothetical protein